MFKQARIPLICTYDSDANAAYIYLEHPIRPGEAQRTLPFDVPDGMVNLDLHADGHVLGLEILDARSRLPVTVLQAILDAQPDQE